MRICSFLLNFVSEAEAFSLKLILKYTELSSSFVFFFSFNSNVFFFFHIGVVVLVLTIVHLALYPLLNVSIANNFFLSFST